MNILITGKSGYIAKMLIEHLSKQYNIISIGRDDFDLTNSNETNEFFKLNNVIYDIVIHTAIAGGNRLQDDNWDVADINLKMYYNLLDNKKYYNKFINIGSGAELYTPLQPYGLSKRVIYESILGKNNFYSLRIFGIFNHKELSSRFIKANIIRYLNKENLIIHQNKFMDFIYFQDFISIILHYINFNNLPKSIDCVYTKKYSLLDIARIINNLNDYNIDINILNQKIGTNYIGSSSIDILNIKTVGLEKGIIETFYNIKNQIE